MMNMKMSSRMSIFALCLAVSAAAGCNSNNDNAEQPAPAAPQSQTGPAWALTLNSACVGTAQNQCLAKYGFSVDATGKYQVGPGPQGQVRTGMLSEAELTDLKAQIQTSVASAQAVRAEGHETDVENVSDDTVTLTVPGSATTVLTHNTAGDFYFKTSNADEGKSLHAAIRGLANSYYRLPFGDACGDGVDKFSAAAAALTSCQVDTDCVYVDTYQGFEVVPPSTTQWLRTEDCTAIQPPVVANKLAIASGAQSLMDLYSSTRDACGIEFSQTALGHDCTYAEKATSVQPVCIQNRCQSRL